jgi:hypothetical protein
MIKELKLNKIHFDRNLIKKVFIVKIYGAGNEKCLDEIKFELIKLINTEYHDKLNTKDKKDFNFKINKFRIIIYKRMIIIFKNELGIDMDRIRKTYGKLINISIIKKNILSDGFILDHRIYKARNILKVDCY